jgi:hypothetical protein
MMKPISVWLRRLLAGFVLVAFVPMSTSGCFGDFRLVKKTYNFNKNVDNDKWIQWFVFLVLSVIPIYGLATLIDVIIANSVEFWTGENPIMADAGTTRVVRGPNGEIATMTLLEAGTIEVVVDEQGTARTLYLVRGKDAVSAFDSDWNLLARVTDVAGHAALVDGSLIPATTH